MSKYGFLGDDGQVCLTRCPKRLRENWAMAVATGRCCWCGYKGKKEDVRDVR